MSKAVTKEQLADCLERIGDYFVQTNEDFTGASDSVAGAKGMVPAPSAGDSAKFLRGDGTWATPAGGGGGSVSTRSNYYGVCNTAAATAAKTVDCQGYKLETGTSVMVKFINTNTASSPTLNVNGTGAKAIYYGGSVISAGMLAGGTVIEFVYDGTNYNILGGSSGTAYNIPTQSGLGNIWIE